MGSEMQEIYQLRFWLAKISPLIWRRFLVNATSTIADFHHLIQLAMNWENIHLHQFIIQGKSYGIAYSGGICFKNDPFVITLKDLQLRIKKRMFYEYNFHIPWKVEIRLEKILPINLKNTYPNCIAGNNIAPSEDYYGIVDFIERQPINFRSGMDTILNDLSSDLKKANNGGSLHNGIKDKITELSDWVNKNKFNRKNLNDNLRQYAKSNFSLEDLIEEVILCG